MDLRKRRQRREGQLSKEHERAKYRIVNGTANIPTAREVDSPTPIDALRICSLVYVMFFEHLGDKNKSLN